MSKQHRTKIGYGFGFFPIVFNLDKDTAKWDMKCWQWVWFSWILKLIWKFSDFEYGSCPSIKLGADVSYDDYREIFHIVNKYNQD